MHSATIKKMIKVIVFMTKMNCNMMYCKSKSVEQIELGILVSCIVH
jgi:hypothetical protein